MSSSTSEVGVLQHVAIYHDNVGILNALVAYQ